MVRILVVDERCLKSFSEIGIGATFGMGRSREAYNGRHALEMFPNHMPQITLMDFIMPEMNGLEAVRHITRLHSDALILMVTTDPSMELEREAKRAGIRGLCPKSGMHCLCAAVETLFNGKTYFSQGRFAASTLLRQWPLIVSHLLLRWFRHIPVRAFALGTSNWQVLTLPLVPATLAGTATYLDCNLLIGHSPSFLVP